MGDQTPKSILNSLSLQSGNIIDSPQLSGQSQKSIPISASVSNQQATSASTPQQQINIITQQKDIDDEPSVNSTRRSIQLSPSPESTPKLNPQNQLIVYRPPPQDKSMELFVAFLEGLLKSNTPLTYLCEENTMALLMSDQTCIRYEEDFDFNMDKDNEVAYDDAQDQQNQEKNHREADDVNIGPDQDDNRGQDQDQDQNQDQPPVEEQPAHVSINPWRENASEPDEQFMTITYKLAEIYQYFLRFDKANTTMYPKNKTLHYLTVIDDIQKNHLLTDSLKSQYAVLMLLPPFLTSKY